MKTLADHLRHYCDIGAPVFPVNGKVPLTPNGVNDATTDPAQVVEWWKQWPDANVGIATGHAFDALDIDSPEAANELTERLGCELTPHDQPMSRTGRGWHIAYAITGATTATRLGGMDVDWRGRGGYIVAPPSIHASGRRYTWTHWTEPMIAPDPVLELLIESCSGMREAPERPVEAPQSDATPSRGRWYPESRYRMVREAVEGERNDTLNRAAFLLGIDSPDAPDESAIHAALDTLESLALGAGLDGREVTNTIRSGYESGRQEAG